MDDLKTIFTQDLTGLSLDKQRQVLTDAENAYKASTVEWQDTLSGIDIQDVPQIVNLAQNLNKVAGGFKSEVNNASHMLDSSGTLEHVQAQLLNSPYLEIQDRAAKDIDRTIDNIVECTRDDKPDFQRDDLMRILFYLSKNHTPHDSLELADKLIAINNAKAIPGLATTLVLNDLVEGKNDIMATLTDQYPLKKLTDNGENVLMRLQQLSTREFVSKIDKKSGPAREI